MEWFVQSVIVIQAVAPLANYKWQRTVEAIDGLMKFEPDPYDGYAVEYINPSNGHTANPTMASWMQKLPKGFHTKAHRHTHSSIYHVHQGSGYTIINGVRFDWKKGDYFVVPNWAWHEHVAAEDSYLFSVNDLADYGEVRVGTRTNIGSEFRPARSEK